MRTLPFLAGLSAAVIAVAAPCHAAGEGATDRVIVAQAPPAAQRNAALAAIHAFYGFWNTGDEALLQRAIAPGFTDHTLPPGRPQGPTGPVVASKTFRLAVPDLRCEMRKVILAGDYATVHMAFTGHFIGKFGTIQGRGQSVSFIATDLIEIRNGRITDNWHIEDNLTLLEQIGAVTASP